MAKSPREKTKGMASPKKAKRAAKARAGIAENVDCLLELHKLQGVLLTRLRKEI